MSIKNILIIITCMMVIAGSGLSIYQSFSEKPRGEPNSLSIKNDEAEINIDEEVKHIAVRKNQRLRPFDVAIETSQAIEQKNFKKATLLIQPYIEGTLNQKWEFYPLIEIRNTLLGLINDKQPAALDSWIKQEPNNPIPYYLRSRYYQEKGRLYRGGNYVSKVDKKDLNEYEKLTDLALADIRKARKLKDNPAYAFLQLHIAGYLLGNSEYVESVFIDSIKKYPESYPLYSARFTYLSPKWGGEINELFQFIDDYAQPASTDSPLKLLYIDLYATLSDIGRLRCDDDSGSVNQDCTERFLSSISRNAYYEELIKISNIHSYQEPYYFMTRYIDELCQSCLIEHAKSAFESLVSKIAKANQFDFNSNTSNSNEANYFISRLSAGIWKGKSNYANTEKYLINSELALEKISIPNDLEHDKQLATIFDELSSIYYDQHRYKKSIVYSKAADNLLGEVHGKPRVNECLAYLYLSDYTPATQSCTRQYQLTGDQKALFWRANIYEKSGQLNKALDDYYQLSDTPNNYRTSAATEIGIIYDRQGQFDKSLEFYEKHSFLFSETTQSKKDLGISYNNRCYALLQLNRLNEALADCEKSIEYYKLPDAVQKREVIKQRLSQH